MRQRAIPDPDQLRALFDAVLLVEEGLELPDILRRTVEAACSLTHARYGALGLLGSAGKGFAQFVYVGVDDETAERIGSALSEGKGILGRLVDDPRPLRLADLTRERGSVGSPAGHPEMHSFLGVPLRVRGDVLGNLYLTEKEDAPEFSAFDQALAVALAKVGSVAIENARLHAHLSELSRAMDRERIARDLHDNVVQRLFATGLSLQAVLPLVEESEIRRHIKEVISDLDETIRQIGAAIFGLASPPATAGGVQARVLRVCAEAARILGFDPDVHLAGGLDRAVTPEVATELLATLREALGNVARYAQARHVTVRLTVDDREVHLQMVDDGIGPDRRARTARKGVPSMAERAERLGGSFQLSARPEGGSEVSWRMPLGVHTQYHSVGVPDSPPPAVGASGGLSKRARG